MNRTKNWISWCVLSLCSLCLCGSFSSAVEPGIDRYDVGQRLVMFERAWDAQPDAAARARVIPHLKLAVAHFFGGRIQDAAAALDCSRLLLTNATPTPTEQWAASLIVHPARRLLDPAQGPLPVRVLSAYAAGDPPAGAIVRLAFVAGDGSTRFAGADSSVLKLPMSAELATDRLPEGDYMLTAEIVVGEKTLATYVVGISAVTHLPERIEKLKSEVWRIDANSAESRTLGASFALLRALSNRYSPETNFPAARLMVETEALVKSVKAGERFYGPQRTGQFWLTLPSVSGQSNVRLFVPEEAKAGKPVPLIVALHGAGGSENMFFDAYGFGLISRLAKERGWMVVAPRAGSLFDDPPPVPEIVRWLAQNYSVDKQRVYLVGHSMGAMQTIALAQKPDAIYAAIAVLGAGGKVTKPDVFKSLPVFIGCGSEDFLLGAAKTLAQTLKKADAARTTYKEYAGIEHILIVQEALPEVFRFFDKAVRDGSQKRE